MVYSFCSAKDGSYGSNRLSQGQYLDSSCSSITSIIGRSCGSTIKLLSQRQHSSSGNCSMRLLRLLEVPYGTPLHSWLLKALRGRRSPITCRFGSSGAGMVCFLLVRAKAEPNVNSFTGVESSTLTRTISGYFLVPIFFAYDVGLYLLCARFLGW